MHYNRHPQEASSTYSDARQERGAVRRTCGRIWRLVVNNRIAIALASLLWLIYRSGSQPRRLSYPCQQVATLNVGAFAAGLIPVLFLSRRTRCGRRLPAAVVVRRQLVAAAIMFGAAVIGVETYQYAATLPNVPPPATQPPPATVAVVKQDKAGTYYTTAEIDTMVERAVSLAGGLDAIMTDRDSNGEILVVLKPNLVNDTNVTAYPENGVVTDYRVIQSLIRLTKEAGARTGITTRVVVAEGTAGPWDWSNGYQGRDITKYAFIATGYTNNPVTGRQWFTYDTSVELIDLNDTGGLNQFDPNKVTQVTINDAVMRRTYWVPNILLQCDVLISVPTFKNHGNADVTLALKNRVGCAPSDIYHSRSAAGHLQQMKHALHFCDSTGIPWNIDRNSGYAYPDYTTDENSLVNYSIVDLNLLRPQDFAVVDGLVGITDGPTGTAKASPTMQLIMAGRDSVAVDTVGTLAMGYNPEYLRYLRWAYNRGLGTMNRSNITVVGNHVAPLRQLFNVSHTPNGSPVETTPPALGNVSWAEGAQVAQSPTTTVQGTGASDNVGLVKAELTILRTNPTNLVVNGGFESGSQGWTTWRSSWGINENWDFNNTEAGRVGTQCLKLGKNSTTSSFGVYQQVAVQPGKTYRLDAYWKGQKLGDANWFEILLLDGPWDEWQADSAQPATIVEANYMYAFDNNTYGLPGAIGTTFGWIWGHDQDAPPDNQVDWNDRCGLRTATGSVMTVVFKAGACCGSTGVAAWFDEVSLVEASPADADPAVVATLANPAGTFNLVWDSTGWPLGSYQTTVTVYDAGLNEAGITRNITLVSGQSPIIALQPTSLTSLIVVGGNPVSGSFTIDNTGVGVLDYTIEVNQPWLNLSTCSGSLAAADPPHQISVYYDCAGLPIGQHATTITVHGQGAENTPQNVAVTVNVTPEPSEVDFSADPTSGAAPLAVQFTDLSTLAGASQWHWDFGDGQTSSQRHPQHSYASQGHFNVRLTVVGSAKTQAAEKTEYIAVANPPKVAFIGGDLDGGEPWPPASDVQMMQYLESKGLVVNSYKDVPAERPPAAVIAVNHDLVIASSSVTSGDVGGEFRYLSVPLVFWEPSLAINGRESLADAPSTLGSQTQINITNNTHPIMAGISIGNVTVLNSSQTLSYCEGSVASGAQVLATVAGNTNRKVVIAAEPGAQLLDGDTAAGKRAMLYLYDATWTQTNATGKQIFDNAVAWSLGPVDASFNAAVTTGTAPLTVQFTDQSTGPITLWTWDFGDGGAGKVRQALHTYAKPGTYTVTLTVSRPFGQPDTMQRAAYIVVAPHVADLDADGDADLDDMDIFQACSTGPGIPGPAAPDCTTGQFASADLDNDDDVDQADFGRFQRCLSGPDASPGPGCAD